MQERLIALYREHFGEAPSAVLALSGDGSNRAYRRLLAPDRIPVIGVMGPDPEENRAFLSFTRAFRAIDLPVPDLYAADEDGGVYLLEDLGDTTLFDALDVARVEAGAEFLITQLFFENDKYWKFVGQARAAGIHVPVVPGIMPITNFSGLVRFSDNCGADIPRWIRKQLEAYADDSDSLQKFGEDVVTDLCRRLLENDVPGLHFYTLNQAAATSAIWNNLSL